jgi:ectoine hydroxylase-related dioxygenase (phytanoyl-CoA dioxygenase family)
MSIVARTESHRTPDLGDAVKAGEALPKGLPKPLPQDLTVAVSPDERARGQLSPETGREAGAAFRKHGCAILSGAFSPAIIDAMYRDFLARYGTLDARAMKAAPDTFVARGEGRYQITPRLSGALGTPEVFANGLLCSVLASLLREDMQLNSFTVVVSLPGASLQPVHRDHGHLFADEPAVAAILPVHAVNVVVPLVDTELATGPTGIWPGSHRWPANIQPQPETVSAGALKRGDCMLLDYRTLHTGLANRSGTARPIACMVYARNWFFDDINYLGTSSLDLPLEDHRKLPESTRPLLVRALSQAMRAQARDAEPVAPARAVERSLDTPPSPAKVGRNDACPCGSGRKFKHCHGRIA